MSRPPARHRDAGADPDAGGGGGRRRGAYPTWLRVLVVLTATLLWVAPLGAVDPGPVTSGAVGRPPVPDPPTPDAVTPSTTPPRGAEPVDRGGDGDARSWPGGVVTWATDVPPRYRWSVRQGVRAWNRAHTGVRFVERHWTRADLWIGVGRTEGAAAVATFGHQPRSQDRVTLQRTFLPTWRHEQLLGRVVAHELGHVLGLRHGREGGCALMHAVVDAGCSPDPVGDRFACRWVGRSAGEAVTRRYGGEFRPGPRTCALRR